MGFIREWLDNRHIEKLAKIESKESVRNNRIDSKENLKITAYEQGILPSAPWAQAVSNIGTGATSAFGGGPGTSSGMPTSGGMAATSNPLIMVGIAAVALIFIMKKK